MSHQLQNPSDRTTEDQNPFAPKAPHQATTGERIARYAVWIAFIGTSVAGIWFAKS